jgi:hypothetical protein
VALPDSAVVASELRAFLSSAPINLLLREGIGFEQIIVTLLAELLASGGGGGGGGGGTVGGALDSSVQQVRALLETGVTHADLVLIAAKLDALITSATPDKVRTASATTAGITSVTANTATQALAARALRNYLLFVNTSDTLISINFSGVATPASSIPVAVGGSFVAEGNYIPPGAVSVICAAPSKSFVIVEA